MLDNRADVTQKIRIAMKALYDLDAVKDKIAKEHTHNTPDRVATFLLEMYQGCWEDPKDVLRTTFTKDIYDQIVYVNGIPFVSVCAHHGLFFLGKAYFGYLPDKAIVGISKIPRLVKMFAKRPQVQEQLTQQIADAFMDVLKPKGCGIVIEAYHLCMMARGVESNAYTKTAALKGSFREGSTKQEFFDGLRQISPIIWP
jgi:GTP cyclohydrolase I